MLFGISRRSALFTNIGDQNRTFTGKVWPFEEDITIRMTGCPNGCGRSPNAEIGFVGTAYGKYNLHIGGDRLGTRLNTKYKDNIGEDEILKTLDELFGIYIQKKKLKKPLVIFHTAIYKSQNKNMIDTLYRQKKSQKHYHHLLGIRMCMCC